jgi:hypothetical protein
MTNQLRINRVRDDLVAAMKGKEISPDDGSLYQLCSDLLIAQFPEAYESTPRKLCAFSLLVGFAAGSAIQKFEDEAEV